MPPLPPYTEKTETPWVQHRTSGPGLSYHFFNYLLNSPFCRGLEYCCHKIKNKDILVGFLERKNRIFFSLYIFCLMIFKTIHFFCVFFYSQANHRCTHYCVPIGTKSILYFDKYESNVTKSHLLLCSYIYW